jgi:RNA polymerase sigma-70 factor (ECF subfamily)
LTEEPEFNALRTQDLLAHVRKGNQDAWREVYRRYRHLLLVAANELTGAALEDAEDVLQSAFLSAWKDIKQFDYQGKGSLRAWLRTIVVHKNIEKLRKLKRSPKSTKDKGFATGWINQQPDSSANNPLTELETKDDETRLFRCMEDLLDPIEAEVLTLRLLEHFDTKQVAEIVELTEDTVRRTYQRAMKKLAAGLNRGSI